MSSGRPERPPKTGRVAYKRRTTPHELDRSNDGRTLKRPFERRRVSRCDCVRLPTVETIRAMYMPSRRRREPCPRPFQVNEFERLRNRATSRWPTTRRVVDAWKTSTRKRCAFVRRATVKRTPLRERLADGVRLNTLAVALHDEGAALPVTPGTDTAFVPRP